MKSTLLLCSFPIPTISFENMDFVTQNFVILNGFHVQVFPLFPSSRFLYYEEQKCVQVLTTLWRADVLSFHFLCHDKVLFLDRLCS